MATDPFIVAVVKMVSLVPTTPVPARSGSRASVQVVNRHMVKAAAQQGHRITLMLAQPTADATCPTLATPHASPKIIPRRVAWRTPLGCSSLSPPLRFTRLRQRELADSRTGIPSTENPCTPGK